MSIEISVIIPIYNDEKYIKECISSVERQTTKNLEIICIDDESSDGSLQMVRNQCELDNRIKVFSQRHAGSGVARNYGLQMAQGEFVAFLDADDFYVDKNALQQMINACKTHGEVVCGTNRVMRINNDRTTEKIVCENKPIPNNGCLMSFLEYQNDYFYTCFIFNRKFLLDNQIEFPAYLRYQDPVFFLKALHYAQHFWMLPNTLYCYRVGHKSRDRVSQNAAHFLKGIKENMEFSIRHGYRELFERLLHRLNVDFIAFILENMSEDIENIIVDMDSIVKKVDSSYQLEAISFLENLSLQPKISMESNIFFVDTVDVNEKIQEIDRFTKKNRNNGRERIVVSLTSYPGRIMHIKYTLYSLIAQNYPADEIVLWLSEDEFPAKELELPSYLLEWERYGVKVRWVKENLKSYKKLIPTLKEYKDDIIVTADDDIYYLPEWLEVLYEEHKKFPEDVIAHRARKIGIDGSGKILPYQEWYLIRGKNGASSRFNLLTGGGGALFPSGSLHEDVLKTNIFMKLLPNTDDIWFWGMAVLNNRRIRVPEKCICNVVHTDRNMQLSGNTLWETNQHDNDMRFHLLMDAYPMIYRSLIDELDEQFVDKCIIYGAGNWGLKARAKYKNILFYVDKSYTGKEGRLLDKKVFGPEVLYKYNDVPIVIAIEKKIGIYTYLSNMGMKNISTFSPG